MLIESAYGLTGNPNQGQACDINSDINEKNVDNTTV